jgi:hypothetical protein
MKKFYFTKGVEKLIEPINVGSLHFMQFFNNLMPKSIQNKLVESSSKKIPYMGFVVEPYSYFLCYEIDDIERAKSLIPDNFELIKTKIFEDDKPKYYCIFGCINAHTSAFWGSRVEFYIIAEDKTTGLLSWIIIDYDSNTISHDKKNGLKNPSSNKSVMTTNYDGTLLVEVIRNDNSRKLIFESDITKGKMTSLDQRLWLEGNLSIGYGRSISKNDPYIFSLKFDPKEVEQALKIPAESFNLEINSWFPGLFKEKPAQLVCFPYAQHFISDSPGHSSQLKNKGDLITAIDSVEFNKIKVFSTQSFKIMFLVGSIVSFFITLTLLILLVLK